MDETTKGSVPDGLKMDKMIELQATRCLNCMKRITPEQLYDEFDQDVLMLPSGVEVAYTNDHKVITRGLKLELDLKQKDLLRVIRIIDPLNVKYEETKVLVPRTYAESLDEIPLHMSVQCLLFTDIKKEDREMLIELVEKAPYQKTTYDRCWIDSMDIRQVLSHDTRLLIMNRRVGGWDGSPERPVIELFGAGGHLFQTWDGRSFITENLIKNAVMEIKEELGVSLGSDQVVALGGMHNTVSNELVVLCAADIDSSLLIQLQEFALHNYEQNTDGIYLGRLDDIISRYQKDASSFAGGEEVKVFNFPSNPELMTRVVEKKLPY